MFPIVTIGYMGNNIYPARAGEVLRAAVLKQRQGVRFPLRWPPHRWNASSMG